MRVALAFALLLLPRVAFGQQKPIITLGNIPTQYQMLNSEEVEADAPIPLTWQADLSDPFTTYLFELTYDVPRDRETTAEPVLVTLDDTADASSCAGHRIDIPNRDDVVSGDRCQLKIRPSQIVREADLPANNPPLDLDSQPESRSIVLQVFIPGQEGDDLTATSQSWTFDYDTRPPPAPTLREALPGENRIVVRWDPPASAGDVEGWEVVYCPNGAGAKTTTTSTSGSVIDDGLLPCAEDDQNTQTVSLDLEEASISDDIQNGIPVAVAVRSVDEFGNQGPLSSARLQTPAPTTDFWELYKGLGGEEDGGFCFVATAAHGSYAHPVVRILRAFRDRVMKASYAGTGLVWAYYRWSPPAAKALSRDAEAASYARIALLPISIFALLWTLLPAIGLLSIGFVIGRRCRRSDRQAERAASEASGGGREGGSGHPVLPPHSPRPGDRFARPGPAGQGVVIALLLLAPQMATAETTRPAASGIFGFAFEFKGGPYLPDMGRATTTDGNAAFARIFGKTGSNALYQLSFDLQVYRGFGTAGVGGSFGFMQWVGKGVYGISENRSFDTTVFNILPVTLVAFYRFDWLADHYPIPLVPYVRGGLAYHFWWITTGTKKVARYQGADPDSPDDDLAGRGGKIGITGTVGMAIMLNHLETAAATSLHNSTGIRGTYLFAEIQAAKVDGFGKAGFDLSEVTWNIGVYFEF